MVKKDKTEPNLLISTKPQHIDSKPQYRSKKSSATKISPSGEAYQLG